MSSQWIVLQRSPGGSEANPGQLWQRTMLESERVHCGDWWETRVCCRLACRSGADNHGYPWGLSCRTGI